MINKAKLEKPSKKRNGTTNGGSITFLPSSWLTPNKSVPTLKILDSKATVENSSKSYKTKSIRYLSNCHLQSPPSKSRTTSPQPVWLNTTTIMEGALMLIAMC